ncbi:MAG: hypothetical protein GXY43_05920 [Clostridiaceae bacterium]|nr:hypothetical protein [Clostridiaceae bacterium]
MTVNSIAIVDPDTRYSKALSERLRHYLPDASITRYSPESFEESADRVGEEIILYDNQTLSPEFFEDIRTATFIPILIPLRPDNDENGRMNGKLLSEQIRSSKAPASGPTEKISSALDHSGTLRLFLSLGSSSRENYIRSNTATMLISGHRLIRMDLMPGFSIPEPKSAHKKNMPGDRVCFGLSDLLLKIDGSKIHPETLLDYLKSNGSGWLYFGRPSRSDDIITLESNHLIQMVRLLRSLVDDSNPQTSAIVVMEGLPFSKVRPIIPLAHEIHVIFPDESGGNDRLINYELEQLFSAGAPGQLRFLSTACKEAI